MNPWIPLRRLVFFAFAVNLLAIAWPDTSAAQALAPDDVVLWTAAASPGDVHGDWVREVDATAAGGVVLRNPDRGRLKVTAPLASPANYFEMRFTARRATPYHLWMRMRARNNSTRNDSVHVQLSDSVDATGQPIIRIGTTSSAEMVLQNGPSGASPQGWGWTDNGWGSLGVPVYFAADGTHVIRIQQREDGTVIDQIVLSPVTFATAAPGVRRSDTNVLPRALGVGPSVSAATSVIRVASAAAGRMFGTWQTISDATAAGSQALRNPDAGTAMIAPALSNPASYFEVTFNADAGRPYHVWVRMRSDGNSLSNDSAHLQFSDSVTSGSSPTARIGTTSSLEVVLQNGPNGPAPHGWGWTDNGWGALGSHVYFAATGTHTLRVQQREDGAVIDQIVISPDTFLTTPAGWRLDDATILQGSAIPPPPGNLPPTVTLTAPANGTPYTAPALITLAATAADPENRLSRVEFYNGLTLLGSDTSAPFGWTWSGVAAGSYQLRAVAVDADGASTGSATVTVGVSAPPSNQPPSVTLTAPANNATFTAPATIALSATASDPENRLARVEFYNGSALLGTDTSAPFSFTWSGVGAGSYQLKAVAVDADGGSATSAIAAVTVAASTPPPFPPGWQHQDIGAPTVAGTASFNNGTFTVTGAGTNIWDVRDQFHFVYQQVTGDVDIIARLASLQGSNEWSKAGVMVRDSLADNARHGLAHFTLSNGSRYTRRTAVGGTTGDNACATGTATGWVRLTRTGSSVQMRYSADGQAWSSCATVTISMPPAVYVGLVVSNVDATQRATAVFDNVSITQGATANQPPTVTLTTNGSTFTAPATITLSATASDPENRLSKVDFYNGSTLLATDTSAPYSFTWSSVPAGSYSLRAVATDADGGSASATATVTVGTSTPGPTRQVVFTASVDHAIVTSYLLEVFPSTANPATATAMASSDLGKPTPSGANEIAVDRSTFLNNLAPGSYLVTVASVGTGGKSRSATISFTR